MKPSTYKTLRTGYLVTVLLLAANALPVPAWARNILDYTLGAWPLTTYLAVLAIIGSVMIYHRKFG